MHACGTVILSGGWRGVAFPSPLPLLYGVRFHSERRRAAKTEACGEESAVFVFVILRVAKDLSSIAVSATLSKQRGILRLRATNRVALRSG